jgi:Zn ribbon nucleic-acid-binding protein
MSLKKKGQYRYGESQSDIHDELRRLSVLNGYEAIHFADAVCVCGQGIFQLQMDESEGAAIRLCMACGIHQPIGDSDAYMEDAELEEYASPCGEDQFEVSVGVALYEASDDVRWLYVGCRCVACGLTATYGDWKNEFNGVRALLERI